MVLVLVLITKRVNPNHISHLVIEHTGLKTTLEDGIERCTLEEGHRSSLEEPGKEMGGVILSSATKGKETGKTMKVNKEGNHSQRQRIL